MSLLWEMFTYPFILRAFVVGILVALCAAGLSVVCFCIGLIGSYLWGTPVGATVVLVNLAAFLLSRGVMRIKRAA